MPTIITPDQRLRVFISSTINELADERLAVRKAVEQLNMTPVYFESGARPHPPKDLYRAYLSQSHIFIGIYWQSYGWVAPDMDISGLEDEWHLATSLPKLIYLKKSTQREPRLNTLLDTIRSSDTACYQSFEHDTELHELILHDLALLLTERFHTSIIIPKAAATPTTNLPHIRKELIGRGGETKSLFTLLCAPSTGLVTIVGAGGTGKTRLAIEMGHLMLAQFTHGVWFVNLSSVNDSTRVPAVVAQSLGVQSAAADTLAVLIAFLYDKNLLLILDNFEQVTEATSFVYDILSKAANLKILVTSRTPLYLREEIIFQLEPLGVTVDAADKSTTPFAVKLFMARANEVNKNIVWDTQNLEAAYNICTKLDGLPLAIELVSARCRFFSPYLINSNLEKILDTVVATSKDYPERQRTLRNTISWSCNFLQPPDQRLFYRLAIFSGTFSAQAVQNICWTPFNESSSLDESLQRLIDVGLLQMATKDDTPRYKYLRVINEYAEEILDTNNDVNTLKHAHAIFFTQYATVIATAIWAMQAVEQHLVFREDYDNLIKALRYAIENGNKAAIWNIIVALNSLYLATGDVGDLKQLMISTQMNGDEQSLKQYEPHLSPMELSLGMLASGFTHTMTGNLAQSKIDLLVSITYARNCNMEMFEAAALLFLGVTELNMGNLQAAKNAVEQSLKLHYNKYTNASKVSTTVLYYTVLMEEGQAIEAKKVLDKAYVESKTEFMPLVESYATYQLGFYHLGYNEVVKAIEYFEACNKLNNTYQLNLNASYANTGLAVAYAFMNKTDMAQHFFEQSKKQIQKSGSELEYGCLRISFCFYLCTARQWEPALQLFCANYNDGKNSHFKLWKFFVSLNERSYAMLGNHFTPQRVDSGIHDAQPLSVEGFYRLFAPLR